MMPDTKYKKVNAELAEAKEKMQKLNEENNALMLQNKRLEAMKDGPGKRPERMQKDARTDWECSISSVLREASADKSDGR
jgi:regulator of replication initiation timing